MPQLRVDLIVDDKGSLVVKNFTDNTSRYMHTASGSVQALSRNITGLTSVMAGLGVGYGAKQVLDTADQYALLDDRLKLVTDSTSEFLVAQEELFDISQRTRNAYTGTIDLYSRLARSTEDLNTSQGDLLNVTEAINKSLIISGSSAQASEAAIIQLGQGFASGVLRGQELNSVMEQAPRLARALADGLGVPIGKLREMGAAGELTAERVFKALLKSSSSIDTEFSKMNATVGQAMTVVNNSIGRFISGTNDSTSATSQLAGSIIDMAGNIDDWAEANQELIQQDIPKYLNATKDAIIDIKNIGADLPGDALDWGIIGFALFKGGPGAAAATTAVLSLNSALEKTGHHFATFKGMAESGGTMWEDLKALVSPLWDDQVALGDAMLGRRPWINSSYEPSMAHSRQPLTTQPAMGSSRNPVTVPDPIGYDENYGSPLDGLYDYTTKKEMGPGRKEWLKQLAMMEKEATDLTKLVDSFTVDSMSELDLFLMFEKGLNDTASLSKQTTGKISQDLLKVQTISETVSGRLEDGFVSAFDRMSRSISDFGDLAEDVLRSVLNEIMRVMIIQPMVGGITGGITQMFDNPGTSPANTNYSQLWNLPGRASGGPVFAGQTYLVGERGPELLHMGSSGNITPNNRIGGGELTIRLIDGDGNEIPTTQTKTANGGMQLDAMIGKAAAADVNNFGPLFSAIQSTFGLKPALGRR